MNKCARFTHNSKDSHATVVERILRYLKGTRTKGVTIQPTYKHDVHCFVYADFGGLWGSEDNQDQACVKSRSGFVLFSWNVLYSGYHSSKHR